MTRKWFQLVDVNGNPLASAGTVHVSFEDVAELRDEVKFMCANTLAKVDAINLSVFGSRVDYAAKQVLEEDSPIKSFGKDEDNPLIVQVPTPRQVVVSIDQAQIDWTVTAEQCPQLPVKSGDRVIELPPNYVSGSGIGRSGKPLVLYRRLPLRKQWHEINRCSIQTYARLWIVGPPGTGKSCAAFAFACSLDRSAWEVVWIHYSRVDRLFNCVWLLGDKKRACVVKQKTVERDLAAILDGTSRSQTRKTIVFLDGYVKNADAGKRAYLKCLRWNQDDETNHRLVCVCSMVSLGKDYRPELYERIENVEEKPSGMEDVGVELSEVEDMDMETGEWLHTAHEVARPVYSQMLFELRSWLLEEYREAVLCDDFFQAVVGMFPAYPRQTDRAKEEEERMRLLQAKYFVAGGSARLMFGVKSQQAIDALSRAIKAVPDIEPYLVGHVGESSAGAVNLLLARYDSLPPEPEDVRLVSDYVVRSFAVRMGSRLLEKFTRACNVNPSMDGWLLESWFFAKLRHEGLAWSVYVESEWKLERHLWEKSNIFYFDPSRNSLSFNVPTWMAPRKWNQGGYDAVFIDNAKNLVRFVQMTRAKQHTFREEDFVDLLNRFIGGHGNQVDVVELYFVVPMVRLRTFSLPVSQADFKRSVMDVASPASQITANVMAIGVDYEITNPGASVG